MMALARVRTPQFRTQLVRKLRNLFPDCEPEFVVVDRGIAFQRLDRRGRSRSNLVRIHRYSDQILHMASLKRAIRRAGLPAAGFPPSL